METYANFMLAYCLAGGVLIYVLGTWLFSKPRTLLQGLPGLALVCFALGAVSFIVTWALAYLFAQTPIENVLLGKDLPAARYIRGIFAAYGLWLATLLFLIHGAVARVFGSTGDR